MATKLINTYARYAVVLLIPAFILASLSTLITGIYCVIVSLVMLFSLWAFYFYFKVIPTGRVLMWEECCKVYGQIKVVGIAFAAGAWSVFGMSALFM